MDDATQLTLGSLTLEAAHESKPTSDLQDRLNHGDDAYLQGLLSKFRSLKAEKKAIDEQIEDIKSQLLDHYKDTGELI